MDMRLFLAVNLPDTIKQALVPEVARFQHLKFREIPEDNWHVTVKFIGEVGPDVVPRINEAVAAIVGQFSSFELQISHLGFLNPKIFAVFLERSTKLYAVYKMIDERLAALGIVLPDKYRSFTPHITVGRKSPGFSGELHSVRHLPLKRREPLTFAVSSVELMESELDLDGAIYEEVMRYTMLDNYSNCSN